MFDLLQQACDLAKKQGCQFADARYLAIHDQYLISRDLALANCTDNLDKGFGVRVLYKGAWGFASSPHSSSPHKNAEEIAKVVALAITHRESFSFSFT